MLVVFWEIFGRSRVSTLVPPFTEVLGTTVDLLRQSDFYASVQFTAISLAGGLAVSLLAGTALGMAMVQFPWLKRALLPYLNALQAAPLAALVPVFMLLFGVGYGTVVAVVIAYTFFAMVFNTLTGFEEADRTLLEMARSYGAGPIQLWRKIMFPAALPMLLAGCRMAVGLAIKGVVIGEMLISVVGLGGLVMLYGSSFAMKHLFALIVLLIILAVAAGGCVTLLERRLLRWRSP